MVHPLVQQYPITTLASASIVFQYMTTLLKVRKARLDSGIAPPLQVGDKRLDIALRVQMNTLESLPSILTALWLSSLSSENDKLCGSIGLIYLLARIGYFFGYPERRLLPFNICIASICSLLGITCYYTVPLVLKNIRK
ncbi:hypothetical protein ABK040_014764 [Willaertia magna]